MVKLNGSGAIWILRSPAFDGLGADGAVEPGRGRLPGGWRQDSVIANRGRLSVPDGGHAEAEGVWAQGSNLDLDVLTGDAEIGFGCMARIGEQERRPRGAQLLYPLTPGRRCFIGAIRHGNHLHYDISAASCKRFQISLVPWTLRTASG
jgi:hypothetical protein